jgi:hypothetical protein
VYEIDFNIILLIKYYFVSVVIGTPDPPTNVSVSCDVISMTVSWRSEFNGGDLQTFSVLWQKEFENETAYSSLVLDPGLHKYTDATIPVTAYTRYIITVQATNTHGSVTSGEHVSCRTSKFVFFSSRTTSLFEQYVSRNYQEDKCRVSMFEQKRFHIYFRLTSNSSIWLLSIIIIILTLITASSVNQPIGHMKR